MSSNGDLVNEKEARTLNDVDGEEVLKNGLTGENKVCGTDCRLNESCWVRRTVKAERNKMNQNEKQVIDRAQTALACRGEIRHRVLWWIARCHRGLEQEEGFGPANARAFPALPHGLAQECPIPSSAVFGDSALRG